ncbi:phage tail protein [Tardiphaga sp. 37S4]|uniref:host specificity factor TipJ family phage tail protein n=1 Tax=Tardiphaga sp. 37S4 TaxID=1404741 RepID=UPI001E2910A7|nr:host specificity factor TipJ family phage tail protein [Tardiphaga sp. 37S4]UFS77228.1 phage tail protein [Tardiphaga sp. 37S4]
MNALIKAPLHGEIIAPEASVRAIGKTHPLNGGRIECHVRAGLSITEILMEALSATPGMVLRRDFVVHIDGHVVEERLWSRVRVKAGATLTFTPRLQGGSLRNVLGLVLAVAALVVAGPIGGVLAASAFGTAIGISAGVATALVSAGIILAGTLALNALFPTRPPDAAITSSVPGSLNSIQGAQNQSNPFGPVPVVLGRHRQSPYYAAKPYTEIIGDDQYLRLLFCWGYGPVDVSEIQIGETPLSAFTEVEIEHRAGFPWDAPITLYPGQVDEQTLAVDLLSADGWQVRTTAPETDEVTGDVAAPQGIYQVNSETGNLDGYNVLVPVQYSVAGANNWVYLGTLNFTRSTVAQRLGFRFVVPRGQYDVRVQKATADANSDKIRDTVTWTALRSIKHAPPIAFPKPLCVTAMRIKATNQLSGVVNTLNGVCQSLVSAFDGANWNANTASQWPPDLFRHVLQGPANARPEPDARIDLGNLQAWWSYCVSNGFKFNQIITSVGSVYDKLCDIAAAGRAVPTFIDGKWGVIWDRPNDSIVQHFTPRNSWGFQGQRAYAQQPHGWRVNFINEKNSFTADERIVYDDGYDASNATLFEGIQFPGVTDPALIWKHGRFQIAQARLRPEKITLNSGWEHLVCTRGDRVRVTHDVLLIGLASGRVKGRSGQVVTFDEVVTIEPDKTYGFQVRVPEDARSLQFSVDPATVAGEYTSLTLLGDLSLVKTGTLFGFGETDQESTVYRVQGISHQKDLIAALTLVDDAPEISQADQGTIPNYDAHVSVPPDPFTLAPQDFRYLEATDGLDNSVRAIIRLSWTAARRGKIGASEVQIASGDADWKPLDVLPYPQFSLDVPLEAPGVWSFRVRFLFDDNSFSKWVTLSKLTLLGLSAPPPDIVTIRAVAYVDSNTSLSWDEVVDYRPIRYAVRKGDSWESGLELGTIAHPPFAAHGNGTYLVKAYCGPDALRSYSVNAAQVEIEGASLVKNVIATRDEKADGWAGVYTGTVAKSGVLIRTGGSSDILSAPDFLGTPDILNLGGQGDGTYEIAPSRYVDARRATACRVTITWKGTGQVATDDILSNPDILNNPDFLAAGSTDLVEVYPEISVAQNDSIGDVFNLDPSENPGNDIFAEPDVFSSDVSFGPWIKYEPGLYVGRWFRARMVLKTYDPQVTAICLDFTFSVDVPDRVDTWALVAGVGTSLNLKTVPAAGLDIVFASNGKTIAEPFNGGPNADALPLIQITNTSASNFDFEVTSLTKNGCTIIPRLAGVQTDAPKTNITIQGW